MSEKEYAMPMDRTLVLFPEGGKASDALLYRSGGCRVPLVRGPERPSHPPSNNKNGHPEWDSHESSPPPQAVYQIEAQRSGFDLEARSSRMSAR